MPNGRSWGSSFTSAISAPFDFRNGPGVVLRTQSTPALLPPRRSSRTCGAAPVTPTPIDSKLLRSPAHAPHIRCLKVPPMRRVGDAHPDRVEIAALPRARPAHP